MVTVLLCQNTFTLKYSTTQNDSINMDGHLWQLTLAGMKDIWFI